MSSPDGRRQLALSYAGKRPKQALYPTFAALGISKLAQYGCALNHAFCRYPTTWRPMARLAF